MKWPLKNKDVSVSDVESAAELLRDTLRKSAKEATKAASSFEEAAARNVSLERNSIENLLRQAMGLDPSESIKAQDWVDFDLACGGRIGIMDKVNEFKKQREASLAILKKLDDENWEDQKRTAKKDHDSYRKDYESLFQERIKEESNWKPYKKTILSASIVGDDWTAQSVRDVYENAGFFKKLFNSEFKEAHRQYHDLKAKGIDLIQKLEAITALKSEEANAKIKANESEILIDRSEKALVKRNDVYAETKKKNKWLDESASQFEMTKEIWAYNFDWASTFEHLAKTRPHLKAMAYEASKVRLIGIALAGAGSRARSESGGLEQAAGKVLELKDNMQRAIRKKGASFKTKLNFDMEALYQGALEAGERFKRWNLEGPDGFVKNAKKLDISGFDVDQVSMRELTEATKKAKAIFGDVIAPTPTPTPTKRNSSSSISSGVSGGYATTDSGVSMWQMLFWYHILSTPSHSAAQTSIGSSWSDEAQKGVESSSNFSSSFSESSGGALSAGTIFSDFSPSTTINWSTDNDFGVKSGSGWSDTITTPASICSAPPPSYSNCSSPTPTPTPSCSSPTPSCSSPSCSSPTPSCGSSF